SADYPPGLLAYRLRDDPPPDANQEWRPWKPYEDRLVPCVKVEATDAFSASNAVGGFARPFGGPQLWSSQPLAQDPSPTLQLAWAAPVEIGEVSIVLDDDVDLDLINLHHHITEHE